MVMATTASTAATTSLASVTLEVTDLEAARRFYADRGLTVAKSVGGTYADFAPCQSSPIKLALYKRRALAKDLGAPVDDTGSHRLVLGSTAGAFTDPDAFAWETAAALAATPN